VNLLLQRRAAGMLLPLSRFRGLNPAVSAPLIVSRVPEFPGAAGYALVAELRVLVMPARGARGRGAEKVVAFLAEAATQRAIADALGMMPARLDAPVRDGAAFEAREAARTAAALVSPPAIGPDDTHAGAIAAAASAVLRAPGEVESIIRGLDGGP
jgi:hypothetical protein